MEDYYLFLTILKQKHLLKKISCNFSWQLLSNLSKACPKISEAINNAKKKATIHFPNELFIACTLDTDHNGTEIKMEHNYSCKSFDFQNISQSFLDIFLITEPPQPYAIKKFGIMVNNSLNEIPYIRKLTLSFSINQEMYYIQELINEIKNDKISEINILIEKDYSHQRWPPTPDITNYKIFDGFKNLEKISLYVEDLIATKRDKKIVDIASTIKGITIDILFSKAQKDTSFPELLSTPNNCILSYIISKKSYLSISNPFFSNNINIIKWLNNLNTMNFTFIRSLSLKISLPSEIRKLSSHLSHMKNLKSLKIVFNINYKCLNLEKNYQKLSENFLFKFSKNLEKLETIQIIWYFNISNLIVKKFMKGQNKISDEVTKHKIERCLEIWQKETFLFLNSISKSIKNLYFYTIPHFTSEITSFLNNLFPNLKFLFLGSIPKIEKNCLRNFKNLKIFVSRDNEPIELPCNVESCMISDLKYFLTNTISIKRKYKYDRCLEYYKKLSCFKKEYDIDGLIVGTILFNNFAELYNIQVYFDDIYRMHKWFD